MQRSTTVDSVQPIIQLYDRLCRRCICLILDKRVAFGEFRTAHVSCKHLWFVELSVECPCCVSCSVCPGALSNLHFTPPNLWKYAVFRVSFLPVSRYDQGSLHGSDDLHVVVGPVNFILCPFCFVAPEVSLGMDTFFILSDSRRQFLPAFVCVASAIDSFTLSPHGASHLHACSASFFVKYAERRCQ